MLVQSELSSDHLVYFVILFQNKSVSKVLDTNKMQQ